jgi:hypothetical protein
MRHNSTKSKVEVKTIGASGQLSLGKKYAGRTVTVEALEDGVWVVRTAQVIPDSEAWLWEPAEKAKLDRALAELERGRTRALPLDAMPARIAARQSRQRKRPA